MRKYNNINKKYIAMPLAKKYELALLGADFVVSGVEENYAASSYVIELYKMHILAVEMLNIIDTQDNKIINENEYNKLIENGIFEKIENIPAIYNDYMIFCKMLDREIENKLSENNDIFKRIDAKIQQEITPELIEEMNNKTADILKTIEIHNK